MAKLLKLRRGTTTQHSTFTGAEGECTVDLDKDVIVVHDGSTQAGHPLAAEDLSNVSSATIVGRLNAASIPTVNIASGALPTNVTITTNNITDLTVATADIANDAVTQAKIADDAVGADQLASNAVVSASIVDGSIVNADVNASAAIAGTKISPDFGSQDVTTTGNIVLDSNSNKIKLGDGQELQISHNGGNSIITDTAHPVFVKGNQVHLQSANGNMVSCYQDAQTELFFNEQKKLATTSGGIDVTGNIAVSGTVDGVDIAAIGVSNGAIASATTATTQSASDNSTKVATTAYVDTAVSNLVDSSPAALNTLNELAAAINDDANFSTTVTNSIATKLPLAGGTLTGNTSLNDSIQLQLGNGGDTKLYHSGSHSYIKHTGTGNFYIDVGNNDTFAVTGGETETILQGTYNGSVDLYHDGTKRLETTGSGVTVTSNLNCGNLFATSAIGLDSTDYLQFTDNTRMDITINGNNEFRFEADGDFHADGDVIAFSTTIASDENLKDNIEEVTDALSKCQAIRGVTFDWKKTGEKSAGVIAQDIQNILPEAVKEVKK